MTELEKMEKRWEELLRRPNSKEEIEEVLILSNKLAIESAKEHKGLTDELSAIGIQIITIWDLVNTKAKYANAIPILLKHLPLDYSDKIKEGIIRSLTVVEAKGVAVPILVNEYEKLSKDKENLRWVIGNAINITITKDYIDKILPIVQDEENGMSRQMFVAALGKIKSEKSKEALLRLVNDDDKVIREVAQKALKKVLAGTKS
jgi:HEAT repeats